MTQLTPNSLATTGTHVPVDRMEAMTTEQLLTYFCELRAIADIYTKESETVKEILAKRDDIPKKFLHADSKTYGSASTKQVSEKYTVSTIKVFEHIGQARFLQVATVTKTNLEKVATTAEMKVMLTDGTVLGGDKSTTIQYNKP
jgi:hypothetical protein